MTNVNSEFQATKARAQEFYRKILKNYLNILGGLVQDRDPLLEGEHSLKDVAVLLAADVNNLRADVAERLIYIAKELVDEGQIELSEEYQKILKMEENMK